MVETKVDFRYSAFQTVFADDSRFVFPIWFRLPLSTTSDLSRSPRPLECHAVVAYRETDTPFWTFQFQWLYYYLAVAPFLFSWHPNLLSCMRLGRACFSVIVSRVFINLGLSSASCHHVLLILCSRSGCFSSSGWVCGFPLQRISSVTLSQKA